MGYSFCAGKVLGDLLFFSDDNINALCCVDLCNGSTVYLGQFPNEDSLLNNQHVKCLERYGKLFFIPNCGSHIHIFDPDSKRIDSVNFPKNIEARFVVSGAFFVDDILWIFPASINQPIITFDIANQIVEKKNSLFDDLKNYKNDSGQDIWKICKIADIVILAILGTSILVKYSLGDGRISIKDSGINNIEGVYNVDDSVVICTSDAKMYQCDEAIETYKELILGDSISNKGAYLVASNYVGIAYFIPNTGRNIYRYDANSTRFIRLTLQSRREEMMYGDINFAEYDIRRDKVVLFPRIGNDILMIQDDSVIEFVGSEISEKEYKENYWKMLRNITDNGIVRESARFHLEDYIRIITD